jgi:hypothetical protein
MRWWIELRDETYWHWIDGMIVARIEGGLGNQLFQYAFGTQLAKNNDSELYLDLSSYASQPQHGYLLDRFSITASEINQQDRKRIPARYQNDRRSVFPLISLGRKELRRLRERPFGFADKYLLAPKDSFLVGYWQSERYFRGVESDIRSQFRPRGPLSPESARLREKMLCTSSIAIHIRRGDYISTKPMAVRNLSLNYYRECVLTQLEKRPDSEVFVFSNDMPWCRENLNLPCPVHYVEHTYTATAHEDLWLMTAADSVVMANSTFSWWGAYLGEREERTIYAPKSWYHPNTLDDRFINCENWIRVSDPVAERQAA